MTALTRHWARWSGWYLNLAAISAWLFPTSDEYGINTKAGDVLS